MDNDAQKIMLDRFQNLPKNIKGAILSIDYGSKLQTIAKDNKLMIDQSGKLEMETMLVMLGLEPLDDYMENLQKNAGLSKNQAIAISHDVNELIFKNIRESLKKMNEQGEVNENPATKSVWQPITVPTREEILADIEKPRETKDNLLPMVEEEPYHENISPVANIVKSKMTETVIVPKENIEIKLESKLPEKSKPSSGEDPYREPIN